MAKLGGKTRTEIVKGSMTPIGLYQTLFNNSNESIEPTYPAPPVIKIFFIN